MKQFATVTVIGRDKTGVIARSQKVEAAVLRQGRETLSRQTAGRLLGRGEGGLK
jgi:hypothetical protein